MAKLITCFEQLITKNDTHDFANIALKFIAKYLSSYDGDETAHPTMTAIFEYILKVRRKHTLNFVRYYVKQEKFSSVAAHKHTTNRSISSVRIR